MSEHRRRRDLTHYFSRVERAVWGAGALSAIVLLVWQLIDQGHL